MAFVTLDLFSALLDSRAGGTAALDDIGGRRGWPVDAAEAYDAWDARNKASQKDTVEWVPFAEHSRRALSATYRELGLRGDADADARRLLESVADWPLWPDVTTAWDRLRTAHRVGVLSNVDDAVFARTRVAPLVEAVDVLTSERLHAYKPHPAIYRRAAQAGVDVHVPASARDTRGALEAGIVVVRVQRPGHSVDPDGPLPGLEIPDLVGLPEAVATLMR
ncbi:HAD family hydrolase [Blastococcus haudaquaticus]|uniref:2-haloacid dehalogenase n=1 Tax=Blastococcus haudaquaticus TaxID=1938745 RepID=A0A286GP25_9ACTN|nr:HAD family hydrolase [Blastococcus haudaquaticus]SOD97311.1 2-haloacid dehalogenase [Blastococcus haudaquaticus]